MGRATQGVRLVNLKDADDLVGIEVVRAKELEEYGQTGEEDEQADGEGAEPATNGAASEEASTDGPAGDAEATDDGEGGGA